MAITYRIYKGSEKVVEGASPLTITGLDAGAKVAAGTYHIVHVQDEKESEKVAIPAFTVQSWHSFMNMIDRVEVRWLKWAEFLKSFEYIKKREEFW